MWRKIAAKYPYCSRIDNVTYFLENQNKMLLSGDTRVSLISDDCEWRDAPKSPKIDDTNIEKQQLLQMTRMDVDICLTFDIMVLRKIDMIAWCYAKVCATIYTQTLLPRK